LTTGSADLIENDYPRTITSSHPNKNVTKRQRKSRDISPNQLRPSTTMEVINHMRGTWTGDKKVKTRAPTSTWRVACGCEVNQSPEASTISNQLEHLK